MGRILRKIGIMFAVFAAALIIYIVVNREQMQPADTVYTVMEEATLPVVYAEMYGRRMNPMYGYRQDMGNSIARESLTILPQDRQLAIRISGSDERVIGIGYEIRSLDLERLVEDTVLDSWEEQEDGVRVRLPIQNLLARDREYLLRIDVTTERHGTVHYYTRIVWTEDETAQSMIALAVDFSSKTFDYEQARELVTYLESNDSEDNSSFGATTIRSSFSQLTWGRLKMRPASELQVTLKELDGIMCCVNLNYIAARGEDSETEYYEVEESFTMKWNAVRTYLMDYKRTVDEIVQGGQKDFSSKRIMLGITNDERVSTVKSADGQVIAYRGNRDLWSYDQADRMAVRVFSFRGGDLLDLRDTNKAHDISVLHVENGGDMDFIVYGYQNRGSHEGEFGVVGYHYDEAENALNERFFIPVSCTFEQLAADIGVLTYQAQNQMLYLYLNHAIYGIDLTSNESMVVADALEDGSFAVSSDQARIAWQEGGSLYEAQEILLMDLESGEKRSIRGAEGEYVRTLGFVGRDLVYGMAKPDALWVVNGRIRDLPMYAVEIMNDQMQVETRYERSGYCVAGVEVEGSRIHLRRVAHTGGSSYAEAQEDTIVCNAEMGPDNLDGIGWYASQDKGKLYFVQVDQEIRPNRRPEVRIPRRISRDNAEKLELKSLYEFQKRQYSAYGGGRLLGSFAAFSDAVDAAYDRMGIVVDDAHRIIWSRVNRPNTAAVRDPASEYTALMRRLRESGSRALAGGEVLLDARGIGMMQMLYFIGRGIPVLGYTDEGSCLLLSAYDTYNVTIYNPATGETYKAGLNDSTEFFAARGNDFVCVLSAE